MNGHTTDRDEHGQSAFGTSWGVEEWRRRQEDKRRVDERLERERTGKDYPYNYSNKPY